MKVSKFQTPYAVNCWGCNGGDLVYLTKEQYDEQMDRPQYGWRCPNCGQSAEWSDENYELMIEQDGNF